MSEELLNRPTSLQGSMTQPRQDEEPVAKKDKKPENLGYEFVQPAREQMDNPDLPLDLGLPASADAFPSVDAIPVKAATPAMDFDLGADGSQAKPKDSSPSPLAASGSLNFDLGDLGENKAQPSTSGISVSEDSAPLDFSGLDFKSPTGSVSADDNDFAAQLAAADRELAAIDKVAPYSPTPTDTVKTSQPEATAKLAPKDFDFGAINLDLPSTGKASEQQKTPSVDSAEMDTKLELAEAYFGIGDKEGARELLDEVIQDGTPEQVARAKESLTRLS